MNALGSIPDWINVVIALLALVGFSIAEREKLLIKKQNPDKKEINSSSTPTMTDKSVDFRAELYSRILIGIMFGLAIGPIYSWSFSGLFVSGNEPEYAVWNTAENTAITVSAIVLSLIFSFVYWRSTPSWASIFVHWVERLALAFVAFWLIFGFIFIRSDYNYDSELYSYYLYYETIINTIISVVLFLLISFPSTPVDWILEMRNKKVGNNEMDKDKSRS